MSETRRAWPLWYRILRFAILFSLLVIVAGTAAWLWLDKNILGTLPTNLSSYRDWRPPTNCKVLAADGSTIDEFYIERRVWVPIAELQPTTSEAFVAAEDRRFFKHPGVDVFGIARALWVNAMQGGVAQGGSTITQQLVKNLIVGKERSYTRKLREAVLAYRLEQELTKDQILELFINYVFLGSGNYGIEAAANDYFGTSARDLDPGQAALIAGLVPAPSRYNPRRSEQAAMERRAIVLNDMVEAGYLAADEAQSYLDDPVLVPRSAPAAPGEDASYRTMVRRELRRVLPGTVVFEEGVVVHTPFDARVQEIANGAVRQALLDLDARQGRRGPKAHLERADWRDFLARAPGLAREPGGAKRRPKAGDCFDVLVPPGPDFDMLEAGPFAYRLDAASRKLLVRPEDPERPAKTLEQRVQAGDVIGVCSNGTDAVSLDPHPWGQGAAVIIENATGDVKALVGGYEVGLEGFVRATQARRQPGSSFKPYVYGSALLGGHTQLDPVLDGPISLPAGNGKIWSPQNYEGGYAGLLPMRQALAKSLNTVAVRLTLESGPDKVATFARMMGVRSPIRADPTVALGSSEVTPMDQALGYATIARMGVPTDPVYIERLVDFKGQEVAHAGGAIIVEGQTLGVLPGAPRPRVLPSGIAYELADMLREVVRAGTGRKASKPGFDRAGKTGTTNDFIDAWFVGFTPRYTVAVWIGSDTTASLGDKETGAKSALPAWIAIVEGLPNVEGERLPVPDDVALVETVGSWAGIPRGAIPPQAGLRISSIDPESPLAAFGER
jgi:penicillin-binding protein 1A